MKNLEKGIPIDPYLLGKPDGTNAEAFEKSFPKFEASIGLRKPKVEHSILNRINCHKDKFDELYKNYSPIFQDKNRYPDMLPFAFNRVKLTKDLRPF